MIGQNSSPPPDTLRRSLHSLVDKIQDPERLWRLYNLAQYLWLHEPEGQV